MQNLQNVFKNLKNPKLFFFISVNFFRLYKGAKKVRKCWQEFYREV